MRRVWVDKDTFENPSGLKDYLAERNLSRFWTVVEDDGSLICLDVHEKATAPLTVVASPAGIPSDVREPPTDPNWRKPDLWIETASVSDATQWHEPLRLPAEIEPQRHYGTSVNWFAVYVWVLIVVAALIAAFVCVRLFYVKYGCPFWPDHGILSACRALTIRVGKLGRMDYGS